jgi:hypothetical protein
MQGNLQEKTGRILLKRPRQDVISEQYNQKFMGNTTKTSYMGVQYKDARLNG